MSEHVRIDMIQKVISCDDSQGIVRVVLTPDPRRYESFELDGNIYWRDRFLGLVFGREMFEGMSNSAKSAPVYYAPPTVKDFVAYARRRSDALRRELRGGMYEAPREPSDQHRALRTRTSEIQATFLSIDVVNSTIKRARYGLKYDQTFDMLFRELGTTVGQFHGRVLKQTGDGLICFLDNASINTQCDNAVDLGIALLSILRGVNQAISEHHPELKLRIGAEHGAASIKSYVIPASGYTQRDIAADALNRAAKIQAKTPPNSFVIGHDLYKLIHVQWLERAIPIKLNIKVGVPDYKTYIVR